MRQRVVTHLATGETTTETMSATRIHLRRRWAPIGCWFRNRWNWRKGRQVRKETQRLRALSVPATEVDADVDPEVRRLAILLDDSPALSVLNLGYGPGEAVITVAAREPQRLAPYLEAVLGHTDDEIVGVGSARGREAVRARNELMREARSILSENPKTRWQGPELH